MTVLTFDRKGVPADILDVLDRHEITDPVLAAVWVVYARQSVILADLAEHGRLLARIAAAVDVRIGAAR